MEHPSVVLTGNSKELQDSYISTTLHLGIPTDTNAADLNQKSHGTKAATRNKSAHINKCNFIARKPRQRSRWTPPSQQGDQDKNETSQSPVNANKHSLISQHRNLTEGNRK